MKNKVKEDGFDMNNVRNGKSYIKYYFEIFSMVAGVLCFRSAKLNKAFDFNKQSMRARQVIQNLEFHYLPQ